MGEWDPRHKHRMLRSEVEAIVEAAKADAADRPAATAPSSPNTVLGSPIDALRHAHELFQAGQADQADALIAAYLRGVEGPSDQAEGEEVVSAIRGLFSSKSIRALRDLEAAPARLAAAQARVREERELLRALDKALRAGRS